jgi:CheY-like chemotaxis protein
VAATARAVGLTVRQARTAAAALELARQHPPGGVILDLHIEGLDVPTFLAGLREVCPVMPRTVAFGSHVEADRLQAARQAGCDQVMPRSRFAVKLEGELAAWLAGQNSSDSISSDPV